MKKRSYYIGLLFAAIIFQGLIVWLLIPKSDGNRFVFSAGRNFLVVEFLDDDLVHFEYSTGGKRPDVSKPIFTSLMVMKNDYPGPNEIVKFGTEQLETSEIKVIIDSEDLCMTILDKSKIPNLVLSTFCPTNFKEEFKGITFTEESFSHVYGLGEKFISAGEADGDWTGLSRYPGEFGNVQESWNNGSVGNDQFPVAFMAGEGRDSYALFVDNPYKQLWDFTNKPWKAAMFGEKIRFYVFTGADLPDLRQDYMELVGKPPVPPKKAFGLWISEYGFDNWNELEDKLNTLRENQFPVDGFVLDLQWYGGIVEGSDDTKQGSLTWDLNNFPNPNYKISKLKEAGIGLILIEQPYVGRNLSEHTELESKEYLVKQCKTCEPVYLTKNPWWGKGGMIDWTNQEASAYWHDWKREPLVDAGITGHWTDLGEPELYDKDGWYAGISDGEAVMHSQLAIHNLYNLLWSQSIYEGYLRNEHAQRPFILSRSGTVGSQRFGVAMWSGDISSLLSSLATHLNVQMHMSMSGVDYYGSDIGGFWRQGGDIDEIYTQWFANGAAFDVPVRAHTFNLCNCEETAPDRIGDLRSNLMNVRQRYALNPYYYSLAHRAYLYGEPLAPPLVYYYQDDMNVRELGGEKMIGKDLLVGGVAESGLMQSEIYLPEGVWIDYHTSNWIVSKGEWIGPLNLYPDGYFTLPLFAKAGAIIPEMYVDDHTLNIEGERVGGGSRNELILRVYASELPSEFILYEDDGETTAYQVGEVRTTLIQQQKDGYGVSVTIKAAEGSYHGALDERANIIHLYVDQLLAKQVWMNGELLQRYDDLQSFEKGDSGWLNLDSGEIWVKSSVLSVGNEKKFEFLLETDQSEAEEIEQIEAMFPAYWPTDAWHASTPEMQGMDSEHLARAVNYLHEQRMDIHQAFIVRNGYVVTDAEFSSLMSGAEFSHRAATDSVLAALLGIAIQEGIIESVEQRVLDFFPDHVIENLSDYKNSLTIEHLLTMTSGFDCNDRAGENSTALKMIQSTDWVQFMLDLPVIEQPGTSFNPCAGASHLLSAVIQASTGLSVLDFAQSHLFQPLGIDSAAWNIDPQGVNVGSFGLYMDLEDTAKFGYLYLMEGKWEGKEIISAGWVEKSTEAYLPEGPYGYGWWVDEQGYFTWGNHQQALFIVPQDSLMVAISGGITEMDGLELEVFMKSLVLLAVKSDAPIADNDDAFEQFSETISESGSIIEPQPVSELPELAPQISGNTYLLDTGESEMVQTFALEFTESDQAYLIEVVNGELLRLPIGLDGVFRVFIPDIPYIDLMMEDFPALKGAWAQENIFVINFLYVYSGSKGTITFTFTDDRLLVEMKVDGMPADVIEGRLE